ncbi:hypothetical protein PG985_002327 [Apiospora marii]|uniref:DNA/RNA-binding protein Alba-like domain-containing protein n=1 Tax=Apiospora marii TaxID=335849 RepID=A0ABR1RSS3_9PEZI
MATTEDAVAQQDPGRNTTTASTKRKRSEPPTPNPAAAAAAAPPSKRPRLASTLSIAEASDAKILAAVESKYDVQTHSVISSSKIQKKVTSVLRHLQPPTTSATNPSPKPRVSVLRARAADAGKLISIAEIAKREMLKSNGARWYQYIALGSETKEVGRDDRPRMSSAQKEGKTVIEDTILGRQIQGQSATGDTDDEQQQHQETGRDEDDEGDDGFEEMKTPFERAIEGTPKIRAAPVMSLFLSPIPIDELRRRYGEQTNNDPADT